MSTTNTRWGTPTCVAASPTPGAAYIVCDHVVDQPLQSVVELGRFSAAVVQRPLAIPENRPDHAEVAADAGALGGDTLPARGLTVTRARTVEKSRA